MATADIYDIRWHRAVLELRYTCDSERRFRMFLTDGKKRIPFEMRTQLHENAGTARLNLMTACGRKPLPGGKWVIMADPDIKLRYVPRLLEDPDAYTMFFRYAKAKYAYAVWFTVQQTDAQVVTVALNAGFYIRNPRPRVRRNSLRYLEKKIFHTAYRLMSLVTRRRGNRILFFKQNAEEPTENMTALIRRIRERGLDGTFRLSFRYRNVFSGGQSVLEWLKDLAAIAGSDYIFIDDYAPVFDFIDLDNDVVLTQLWHAGVGFKSVGYARFGLDGSPDPFSSAHRHYTWALVGNEHLRDIYAEVFGIEREAFLATGLPRLDHFMDDSVMKAAKDQLYRRYPRLKKGRVILFAPTFRGTGQKDAFYPYEYLDAKALYDLCEKTDSYFIYEMHHFIKERPRIPAEYAGRILDLTDENLNELFYIADVLITDYSSCFYDFLLMERPVILYLPDKTAYIAGHGIQRPIDALSPGEICETFEALIDTLRSGHYEQVKPKSVTIDRAAEHGMLASDRVIDTILLKKDVPGVRMDIKEPGCE